MTGLKNILLAALFLNLVACETPTDNAIEEARQCSDKAAAVALNNAAAAAPLAAPCMAMLGSANTAEANQILFGDYLIKDQIMGNIVQAASAQTGNSGGVASINSMLLVLVDPIPADVPSLVTAATSANSTGMVYVAGLISMATTLNALATLTTPGNVASTINTCATTPPCNTNVQNSYNTLASAACASNGGGNATVCSAVTAVNTAAGPNPTAQQLVTALANYAASPH